MNNSSTYHNLTTTHQIPHYQIVETVYSGSRTVVYRALRTKERLPVVIKLLKNEYPTFSELVQFRNQYTIAKNLHQPGIIQTYSLEPYQNGYALVMEDFGGISLKEWAMSGNLQSVQEFLAIAIALCNALYILYRERIIHKDIKPSNILIHPETKQVKLIDFSIASLLPRETQTLLNLNVLEGTLAYISPEQTGRMNRGIDYRTDFYSIGVTFYELLTGELPFQSNEPMELVHCHIAKTAPLVHKINPEIPPVLSKIVSKLIAKNAEDRYQSALGLKFDLENCLTQIQETGEIRSFEIGTRDVCDRFLIPEKLYGREAEVQALLDAFDRVVAGSSELMLVAGFSGIGKTAVVNEVHKPITRQNGYFIKGKFDQFNRNIPFSAFVQAFRDLMAQLLSESDVQIQQWRNKILEAVGENGQVIIEVIPELSTILGEQPPAVELSGTAAENRFNLLFQKFTQVFTAKKHPLVIFLDDLQWADSASLKLMQLLIADTGYLLIIGAYRDNEVYPAHPLMLTLNEIQQTQAIVNTITLAPLSQAQVTELVTNTLKCPEDLASNLSVLIYQKTQGNPFFATQFLKALHQDRLIHFDFELGCWQCDISQIKTQSATDDVVAFISLQLQKLPSSTQEVLQLAACIGNSFDLATLSIVSEQSEIATAACLWKALKEGLILPIGDVYKFYVGQENVVDRSTNQQTVVYQFIHDRVQQAAYSLIPDHQKQLMHLKIGQLLLSVVSQTEKEERIFEIVNQLNQGIDLIKSKSEREELAKLNLDAAQKAKYSTAYIAAIEYANKGIELLGLNCWQQYYEVTLALYNLAAEAACLIGDFRQMQQIVDEVVNNACHLLDKVKVYEVKILSEVAQSQQPEAIRTALSVLKLFGIVFPEYPTATDISQSLKETQDLFQEKDLADLLTLPEMTDPQALAKMRILATVTAAVYQAAPELLPLIVCKQVRLSVHYGNAPVSAQAFAWYGVILCSSGEIDLGDRIGEIAMGLLSYCQNREFKASTVNMVYPFVKPWKHHIKESLIPLLDGYYTGLEMGTLEYAAYCAYNYCSLSYFLGKNLSTLELEIHLYNQALAQLKQEVAHNYLRIFHQSVTNLLTPSKCPWQIQGVIYDEQVMLPLHQKASDLYAMGTLYINKLVLCYFLNEWESATIAATQAKQYLSGVSGCFMVPLFHFYDSLIHLATLPKTQDGNLKQVIDNQNKLREWSHYAPANHSHKFDLVEAERYRVFGQNYEAGDYYDRAISGAKANEYIQEEALANELAAKFYLNWGKEKIAAGYMQEAYYCYARWGAKAKTDDLETRYPELLRPILQQSEPSEIMLSTLTTLASPGYSIHSNTRKSSSSSSINTTLDFAAILKASQALSRVIQLEDLLYQLTQIILQNSGGDRCALILPSENKVWEVRAIATPTETLLYSEPLENNPNLPVKLIQYVKNTQQVVVIDDLKTDLPVIEDYLRLHQPKSVLCLPILNQGHLLGILYLKNRLTSGVFTSDRIIILDFLCTQVAISLENARLYNQVKQTLTDLQNAQLQIVQSEKMSALGNLVAGVAHEINNPVGCIIGNVDAVQESINDLFGLIDLYQEELPQPSPTIAEELETIDLEYLRSDLPKLVRAMKDGGDRIKSISKSLRTFSRADSDHKQKFNLHEGIDSTILILRHRLKANELRPAIQVITNYGNIPNIHCFPGQLNQVFMNILANAIDALEESNIGQTFAEIKANHNCINIQTSVENEKVKIAIADNGHGMTEEVKQKIFDHLFTTKTVGKGTGLGLAIARQIIDEKHQGSITVNSTLEEGTEFIISLPIKGDI